jgi:hypothetical protein
VTLHRALTVSDDARIMMRWWWFGPSMTRHEASRQLRLMMSAGIGGVEVATIYPISLDHEVEGAVNLQFLSPAHLEVLSYAAQQARELGMRFDVTLCSGWPYGGPHIPSRLAARGLRTNQLDVPPGTISLSLPELGKHEHALAAVADCGTTLRIDVSLASIDLAAAPATRCVTLLTSALTGQKVKRAALGAEGLVLDHYSLEATLLHLSEVGERLLGAAGVANVRAIFTDSLEVYNSNWTDNLSAEFLHRRGYDLLPHMPSLLASIPNHDAAGALIPYARCAEVGPSQDAINDVQHDLAFTLTELLHHAFLAPVQKFAHDHGILSRVQAYGVPPASLASYRYVDLPEGETTLGASEIYGPADWTEITPNRIAASASRHQGVGVTSGETWTRLHSPPYAATPLDLKAEADRFFLQGINQIIGHGWCHRPETGDPSQWVFYAAGNFNETNPWFAAMPDISRYLQTVSSLLRQGEAVADVALYLPDHDAWARQTLSPTKANMHHVNALRDQIGVELPAALLRLGYNFDLVDDYVVHHLAEAGDRRYRIVILPGAERMPIETLRALRVLAERGVLVVAIGRIPDQPIGRIERAADPRAVAQLALELFDEGQMSTAFRISLAAIASLKERVPPDVEIPQNEPTIGYVHRRLTDADLYFFANTSNRPVEFHARLRETRDHLYLLDPRSQQARPTGSPALSLAPYESVMLLSTDQPVESTAFGSFYYVQPRRDVPADRIIKLDRDWTLSAGGRADVTLNWLTPWSEMEPYRHHSGSGVYKTCFDVDADLAGATAMLIFDDPLAIAPHRFRPDQRNTGWSTFFDTPVKDAAEIRLNGQFVGRLWCPPYRLDLTGKLRAGENHLEIEVFNRLSNRLAAGPCHDFAKLHDTFGQRFADIQDADLWLVHPAGLSGRVAIQFALI